jgi:protein-L-isoaspartate O-methyltransferase
MICQRTSHWNIRRKEECRTLIRWLDPRPGERILDIGCGDGYYDALIAKSGAHVLGGRCPRRTPSDRRVPE